MKEPAHLPRGAFYVLLLLAVCVIPFALGQRVIIQRGTVTAGSLPNNSIPSGVCDIIVNGGFETGDFTGWTIDGFNNAPVVTNTFSHSGSFSAFAGGDPPAAFCGGGAEPTGDSSFYQQFTLPAGESTLSFWHWGCGTTSITFDWQDAYITDRNGTILQTIFHLADNKQTWFLQTVDMTPYAGQTVRLKFLVHQDGFGDLTGMYVDDVQLTVPCASPTPTPTPTLCDSGIIVNGGFETGSFPPWVIDGTNNSPVVTNFMPLAGNYSAFAGGNPGGNQFCGSGNEPLGDSSFYQQFTVPAGLSILSFWYRPCTIDTIAFDWQDAYITDTNGNILQTIFHQCTDSQEVINQVVDMTPYAGQTVRLKFLVHQDGYGDLTGIWVDTVALLVPCGTPTPTATPKVTPTATLTPTPTVTATATATATAIATATATPRIAPTPRSRPTPPPRP